MLLKSMFYSMVPLNSYNTFFKFCYRFDSNPSTTESESGNEEGGGSEEKKSKKKKDKKPKTAKTIVSRI